MAAVNYIVQTAVAAAAFIRFYRDSLCPFPVKLQSSELSESERNEIENMVRELIQKSKAGEPSKNVASKIFSWLADKGGDALVQMIPLIASGALLRG